MKKHQTIKNRKTPIFTGESITLSRIAKIRSRSLSNSALSRGERKFVNSLSWERGRGEGNSSFAKQTVMNLFTYLPIHLFTSKKVAFTLAEVLITLGIIGVVAAITLPTLTSRASALQNRTKYKKAMSVLGNADKLSKAKYDYGFEDTMYDTCNAPSSRGCGFDTSGRNSSQSLTSLIEGTIANTKYFSSTKNVYSVEIKSSGSSYGPISGVKSGDFHASTLLKTFIWSGTAWQTTDGVVYSFYNGTNNPSTPAKGGFGFIDVNGKEGPNTIAKCVGETARSVKLDPNPDPCLNFNKNEPFDIYFFFISKTDGSVHPATSGALSALLEK